MRRDFMLDALEQALYERRPAECDGLVHHSDRGAQYVSIRYTERLVAAGIEPYPTLGQLVSGWRGARVSRKGCVCPQRRRTAFRTRHNAPADRLVNRADRF